MATVKDGDPALMHLPWLAGASGSTEASRLLAGLMKHPRAEVHLQAIRILNEFPALRAPRRLFVDALADAAPRVQLAALPHFFRDSGELPQDAVVKLAVSKDTYLRQTATRVLAQKATLANLAELMKSADAATRLAGVMAVGTRLTVPASDYVPPEKVTLAYPHENAQFTLTFADADQPVNLCALGRTGSYTTAQWWKVIETTAQQKELFDLLLRSLEDAAAPVQLQGAYYLSLLRNVRSESRVAKVGQEIMAKQLAGAPLRAVEKVWLVGPFEDGNQGLARVHPPEEGVIDLTAEYPREGGKHSWQEAVGKEGHFDFKDRLASSERSSSYLYYRLQERAAAAGPDAARLGRCRQGLAQWPARRPECLRTRPETVVVLFRHPAGKQRCAGPRFRCQRYSGAGTALPGRGPATYRVARKARFGDAGQRLKEGGGEKVAAEFLKVNWTQEVQKGDTVRGRKLFGTLGCAKCHAITAEQKGGGGPSLAEAKRRFTVAYTVESILLPSKQVAEPFRSTNLMLTTGQVISGLVVQDTDEGVELLLPDASRRTIRKKVIEERTLSNLSPMPAGLVKTTEELRDLLAYLLSDLPLPP